MITRAAEHVGLDITPPNDSSMTTFFDPMDMTSLWERPIGKSHGHHPHPTQTITSAKEVEGQACSHSLDQRKPTKGVRRTWTHVRTRSRGTLTHACYYVGAKSTEGTDDKGSARGADLLGATDAPRIHEGGKAAKGGCR
jgi:hypothetical protein